MSVSIGEDPVIIGKGFDPYVTCSHRSNRKHRWQQSGFNKGAERILFNPSII
jgi:hypothetical protein